MNFHIITLFPKAFSSYLGESILKRAIEDKKIRVKFYNPRDFARDKRARVDRKPFGGGPGMVIQAEPVIRAIEKALRQAQGRPPRQAQNKKKAKEKIDSQKKKIKIIWLTPSGKQFTNMHASRIARNYGDIIIVCGRYEGIDARVKKVFKTESLSIGPFVLTGGELPAMVIMDSVSRQKKGVLGKFDSLEERRVSSSEVYTRPEVFSHKGIKYSVPKILLSGDHKKIEEWKNRKKG